jgi:hypothetical protein
MNSKVLIGIIGNDFARAHEFTASALRLKRPHGSDLEFLMGGDWCSARNQLGQQALDGGYTHLWFMDDDHSFGPDLLERLLAWEKPLVTPMCLQRVYPFAPVSYVPAPPELAHLGDFVPIDLGDQPGGGLVELAVGGAAGMLIRRDVLEATARPWFEYGDQSEDILFCQKAQEAGYTLWGDLGAKLGHITTLVVFPSFTEENGWTTGLRLPRGPDMNIKQVYDLEEYTDAQRRDIPVDTGPTPATENPMIEPPLEDHPFVVEQPNAEAERIEIWVDEDNLWWWRALNEQGVILARDSGVREQVVIERALSLYPGAPVHQIAREIEDSRKQEQYGPPRRIWNRGVGQ